MLLPERLSRILWLLIGDRKSSNPSRFALLPPQILPAIIAVAFDLPYSSFISGRLNLSTLVCVWRFLAGTSQPLRMISYLLVCIENLPQTRERLVWWRNLPFDKKPFVLNDRSEISVRAAILLTN